MKEDERDVLQSTNGKSEGDIVTISAERPERSEA
jgi:hypothetical protein